MLSEVPEGWDSTCLSERFSIDWGDTSTTKKSYVTSGYKAYSAAGPDGYLPYYDHDQDGVVVSAIGANSGRVFLASGKWSAIKNTMVVFQKDELSDIVFFFHLAQMADFWPISGGAQPFIGLKNARKSQVVVPPLPEQKRIAEILSSVDESIQATQSVIDQAERVKRGLMEDLLTGGLGSEAIARGEVPEGWSLAPLSSLTDKIGSGVTPKGGRKAYVSSGYQLVRSQNVGWGELMLDDVVFITSDQHERMKSTQLQKHDVLLNITGASIGRSAVFTGQSRSANVNQHVCILRTNHHLSPSYLNAWLLSSLGQKTIDDFQAGGNRQGLNFQKIGSFPISVPPLPEQKRIAAILSSVDEFIQSQKKMIDQYQVTKKGLMDDLLTGKVRTV